MIDETDATPVLPKRRLADILADIAADTSRERISIGDLVAVLKDRAFGALMLIFAIPNAIPTPPGTSAILGAPLVFLAAQLAFGRQPWLPGVIANRSVLRTDFAKIVEKIAPWIARAERLLKPRLTVLTQPPTEYVIGVACLLMATILFLPIPLGNMLPAIAISFFSLALLERDGVWVLIGFVLAALSTVVVSGVILLAVEAVVFLIGRLFA